MSGKKNQGAGRPAPAPVASPEADELPLAASPEPQAEDEVTAPHAVGRAASDDPRVVKVKALRGVTDTLRILHRYPGEIFRLREDDAKRLESQGAVEILG